MEWSTRPSEQRPTLASLRRRGWQPIKQAEFTTQSEQLNDDIRGLKLAQLRVEKDIQTENLEQKNIQLGTAKEKTKQVKEQFVQATYQTVLARTQTAKALDQTALATKSWDSEQSKMRTCLASLQLSEQNDAEKLIMDRRTAVAAFN